MIALLQNIWQNWLFFYLKTLQKHTFLNICSCAVNLKRVPYVALQHELTNKIPDPEVQSNCTGYSSGALKFAFMLP